MALHLAQKGASIMLLYTSDSSTSRVDALITRITSLPHSPRVTGCRADHSSPTAPAAITSALTTWLGGPAPKLYILVNNAGTEFNAPLGSTTTEDFAKVYDLNVRAPLLLTRALLPYLNTDSRIIKSRPSAAASVFPGLGLYCSSKAALEGLTRYWARELGVNGTTVNCVVPGPVQSDMLENIPKDIVDMQKSQTPVQMRIGTTEEVARIVGWLASEEASWVSGQVISASGGWAMY